MEIIELDTSNPGAYHKYVSKKQRTLETLLLIILGLGFIALTMYEHRSNRDDN